MAPITIMATSHSVAREHAINRASVCGECDGRDGYSNKASLYNRDPERQTAYSKGYAAGLAIRMERQS